MRLRRACRARQIGTRSPKYGVSLISATRVPIAVNDPNVRFQAAAHCAASSVWVSIVR